MKYSVLSKYRTELMGLAMLWVMLFHAWGLDFGVRPLNFIREIGFGGVDIFILLSAMGLVMSLCRKERKFGPFMARRAARVLPSYFVVMLPYTVFLILWKGAPVSALLWNSTLLSYWVQADGRFNWYISGIMLFYALTPLCFRWMKKAKHREGVTAAGMAAGFVLCWFLMYHNGKGYLDVAYRIPIFFLGLLTGFYAWEERDLGKKDILFWCFWSLCGIAYYGAGKMLSEVVYLPLCLMFLFLILPLCLLGCLLFERLPLGGLRWFLRLIGESSLEIYLLNVSFVTGTDLLRKYLDFGLGRGLYHLITISLNLAVGLLFHRMMTIVLARVGKRRVNV